MPSYLVSHSPIPVRLAGPSATPADRLVAPSAVGDPRLAGVTA
jgi:hypothetical protein